MTFLGLSLFFEPPLVPQKPRLRVFRHPLRGRVKPDLVASVWFSDIGFIKVGVLAPRPDTIMLLKALDLMGIQDDEAFSILEGLLGIKERGALEICLLGDSFVVEAHYDLAAIVPRT